MPIAIQLFSLRESMKNDIEGTLAALREMGYDGVEFAGLYGRSAVEMRDICERIGLIPISAHEVYTTFRDELENKLDDYTALGCKYVAISSMHLEFHKGGAEHEGVYDTLREISKRFRERGIKLLYHNHSYEMCEIDGKRAYDWLFDAMSEDELQPEIDTAWLELEVGEAEQYIRKFKNRCDLVHVKSYYGKDGFDELVHDPTQIKPRDSFDFCNFNVGRLDLTRMVNAAKESGAKWLVVEQDRKDEGLSELESAKINIDALRALE